MLLNLTETKNKSLNKWSRKVIYAYSFSSSWLHMLPKKRSYAYNFLSSSLGIFQEHQSQIVVAKNLSGDPSY
ncbi:hypothetical protein BDA96_09G172800 [Sorghum bicolor]|uniref:Uncharacterized protein n=2 Tax=Sorghum bicolor TaxID=4558 RepID=A0A921QCV7_SORBI|nr:hypothetical protein BDA96_09G172800 [Sorghum bicolor]